MTECTQNPWVSFSIAALWFGYALLEFWLGKTEKVKSSSTIELIIVFVVMVATYFFRRKENDGDSKP